MDAWDLIRKAARDKRSGAAEIAALAARGVALLETKRDVMKAARLLLRAHPAMASLLRLLADALVLGPPRASAAFAAALEAEAGNAALAARWVLTKKSVVLTHSSSSTVVATLRASRKRVVRVMCTESLPGGEGKALARRLTRDGFDAETVPDAAMISAAGRCDLVLAGSDAITEDGVVNKIGTHLLALAARETSTPFYAVAGSTKLLPAHVWRRATAPLYDTTPLRLIDGVITERGVLNPAAVRRAVRKVRIPEELAKVVG